MGLSAEPFWGVVVMKQGLRWGGMALLGIGLVFLGVGLFSGPKAPVGEFTCQMKAKDQVISGVYKVYGVKDAPVHMWLAKTVFRNGMDGRVTDLKVRYRVTEYAEWSAWHNYPAVDPSQTVVDLYHPIFTSACAKLTSRAPAELLMEAEYTDSRGQKHQLSDSRSLTMLSRHEFIFSDLTSEERTASFQDQDTYSPLMAGWVSRSDDVVSRLASMANKKAGGVGASSNDEDCIKVMSELYEIMRTIHISYQHPQVIQDPNLSYDIKSVQSLQYPRDTIQKKSGTCIDLAILYAAMLNSVNIQPYLVSMDGHCFPMARAPSGNFIPVEATGVGDGYEKSFTFEQAVKKAMETWQGVNQSGRFNLVDVRGCWALGVGNPELEPLPPDILEKWGIVALVEGGGNANQVFLVNNAPQGQGGGNVANYPNQQEPSDDEPIPRAPRPSNVAVAGKWGYRITSADGRSIQGEAQITGKGQQLRLVATSAYSLMGADGRMHRFTEHNDFVGTLEGGMVVAQCNMARYTMDGSQVAPQGLPMQMQLQVSPDGSIMQGQVANSMGMVIPIYLQRMR